MTGFREKCNGPSKARNILITSEISNLSRDRLHHWAGSTLFNFFIHRCTTGERGRKYCCRIVKVRWERQGHKIVLSSHQFCVYGWGWGFIYIYTCTFNSVFLFHHNNNIVDGLFGMFYRSRNGLTAKLLRSSQWQRIFVDHIRIIKVQNKHQFPPSVKWKSYSKWLSYIFIILIISVFLVTDFDFWTGLVISSQCHIINITCS